MKQVDEMPTSGRFAVVWQLGRNGCGCLQDKAINLGITKSGVWTN